jgi:uncharacterized protein YjaG (DUF416 family)
MPPTIFDENDIRDHLATLGTRQLIAFAAFWAQRLMPLSRRFSAVQGIPQPDEVQACLDLAWLAATGDRSSLSRVNECQSKLENLAPDLEARPILAYAAMECTASAWDALAVSDGEGVEHAMTSFGGFKQTIEHFLINRDHQGVLIATKRPDPLGLASDPIWNAEADVLNTLLLTLAAEPAPTVVTVGRLKVEAEQHMAGLVDAMEDLSRVLSRSKT